jgi:TolB-like protein
MARGWDTFTERILSFALSWNRSLSDGLSAWVTSFEPRLRETFSMVRIALLLFFMAFITSCASTTSVSPSAGATSGPLLAVMPLEGEFGTQASDMITHKLLDSGFRMVERSQIDQVLKELGYAGNKRFADFSLPKIGRQLGVQKLFVGSVTAAGGPLSSFEHVNINLRLVSVSSGEILWAAKYGNPMWTSAMSTQGDIQRGARDLVNEFKNTYAKQLR